MNPITEQDTLAIRMIEELTGCGNTQVLSTYLMHKRDILATMDALIEKPVCAGDKYIPAKPSIESGMTQDQEDRCTKGRALQDKINAVFSVAHSKTQTQLVPEAPLAVQETQSVVSELAAAGSSE
jgi:hypothetical protein